MTELFDNLVTLLTSEQSSQDLSEQLQIDSPKKAGYTAALCVPIILDNLHLVANDSGKIPNLMIALRTVESRGLLELAPTIKAGTYEPFGSELLEGLLGDQTKNVAGVVSAGGGTSQRSAQWLLSAVAWAVTSSIVRRYGNRLSQQSLVTLLGQEHISLLNTGWAPWLSAASDARAANSVELEAIKSDARGYGLERSQTLEQDLSRVPEPDRTSPASSGQPTIGAETLSYRPAGSDSDVDLPGRSLSSDGATQAGKIGPLTAQSLSRSLDAGTRTAVHESPESNTKGWKAKLPIAVGVGALLAVFLVWGVYFVLQNGASDEQNVLSDSNQVLQATDVSTVPNPLPPVADAGANDAGTETTDTTVDDGASNASTPKPAAGGVSKIDVLMTDPLGRTEATGIAEIRLDVEGGEVCYNVTSEQLEAPYDTHIHVGPAGEKGPIVVDFGSLNSGDIGCIVADPVDLAAIDANRTNHYYELHEPSTEITIRAQLSEELAPGDVADGQFDPKGGGARAVIEPGRITLTGNVADQATLDLLTQQFATDDMSETELVNELQIAADSPPPTGLIEVDDEILFDVASAELGSVEGTVIEDLANLFRGRPDWTMAVVGHTDSTGTTVSNLELSLERAEAVRGALVGLGMDNKNLRVQGAGDTQPIATNETDAGRALNRRIEFVVDPPTL